MKLNEKMRYPHPVLSEFNSDYATGELEADFHHQITEDGQLNISSMLSINCDELKSLIENQQALAGYFIVCRRTYFNRLQGTALGEADKYFDLKQFYGKVILRPVIWTLQHIENYHSSLIHDEFGEDIAIGKGSIVALGPEFSFSIDEKKFKPFESVFELAVNDDVGKGMFEVDPYQDKIIILAESETYESIAGMRNVVPAGRSILLNSVFMPAVMEIIARLQAKDNGLESRQWFGVFKAKCDDMGIQPEDDSVSPLHMAQQLLKEPLKGTIRAVETMG